MAPTVGGPTYRTPTLQELFSLMFYAMWCMLKGMFVMCVIFAGLIAAIGICVGLVMLAYQGVEKLRSRWADEEAARELGEQKGGAGHRGEK